MCLSTMTGEKPRTRRAPGSTLGSGRQGGFRNCHQQAFLALKSRDRGIPAKHGSDRPGVAGKGQLLACGAKGLPSICQG